MTVDAVILTVSDRAAAGTYDDLTGPAVAAALFAALGVEAEVHVCTDDRTVIAERLRTLCATSDLVLTNGGTGVSPRDVTPEATADVVDRLVPGLAERMRIVGAGSTPLAALSRQVCGIAGTTLIVNLPGSPRGAVESFEAIGDLLPHAIETIRGGDHL